MLWPFSKKAGKEDLEELQEFVVNLRDEVEGHDEDIDQLLELLRELQEAQKKTEEKVEDLEEDTKRLDQVIQEVKEEALEDQQIDLQPMEQEIFKVLMRAEEGLKYKEIGKRMEKERTADQVRPKLISLKDKITILEKKDGRAKVFSIPKKTKKDYIEKGELTEIENKF